MIQFRKGPNDKVLELGGGQNRNPMSDCNVDVRSGPGVDFTADFNEPLPIKSDEWDGVFSMFVIEHLSWRSVRGFLKEVFRILKPGGRAVFVTANTGEQIKYILANPGGWDGRPPFDSFSCILFGDNDYPENTHRNYMSPEIATGLFSEAGFESILTQPYGAIATDMLIQAVKPIDAPKILEPVVMTPKKIEVETIPPLVVQAEKEPWNPVKIFDRQYFNGGKMGGGFAPFYWDFPVHEITAKHILIRNPQSVLELGCGRGYVLKRIHDARIQGHGMDVSKHCYMTRVAEHFYEVDISESWGVGDRTWDLCYSIAVLEHIPEDKLPFVLSQMKRTCKRGLHGIGFYQGNDQTKVTVRPQEWWEVLFKAYGLESHEIVSKDVLEAGEFPPKVAKGDGKLKLNIGCYMTMFHHGWINIDIHDHLNQFAQGHGYKYLKHDSTTGLPYKTGEVDLIYSAHFLEHLDYRAGQAFLKECRRVLKPNGAMRILVPDGEFLNGCYNNMKFGQLSEFDEVNEGCALVKSRAQKLYALLHHDHKAIYDSETLCDVLQESGFLAREVSFRSSMVMPTIDCEHEGLNQILRETLDVLPCLTLYVDAIPSVG